MAACSVQSRPWAGGVPGREAAARAAMEEAGFPEEPPPDRSLCQYAQQITACFGGKGKTPSTVGFAHEMPRVDKADEEKDET